MKGKGKGMSDGTWVEQMKSALRAEDIAGVGRLRLILFDSDLSPLSELELWGTYADGWVIGYGAGRRAAKTEKDAGLTSTTRTTPPFPLPLRGARTRPSGAGGAG